MNTLARYIRDFTHLVFPINCYGCNNAMDEHENLLCNACLQDLPKTHYWDHPGNAVEKFFWGKIPLNGACSYIYFSKGGIVQSLLHHLKYHGRTEVGDLLGALFARELLNTKYAEVDIVIPVPLHKFKKRKRGYNQCDFIARSMASGLNIDYHPDAVERLSANQSQTRKGRYERWINVKELFNVAKPELIEDKHVLIIDDVVTTGSTLEACAEAVLKVPGTQVSLATIACPSPV